MLQHLGKKCRFHASQSGMVEPPFLKASKLLTGKKTTNRSWIPFESMKRNFVTRCSSFAHWRVRWNCSKFQTCWKLGEVGKTINYKIEQEKMSIRSQIVTIYLRVFSLSGVLRKCECARSPWNAREKNKVDQLNEGFILTQYLIELTP